MSFALSSPDEWYYDLSFGKLYYAPRLEGFPHGEDNAVVVPIHHRAFNLSPESGRSNKESSSVQDITIQNLAFKDFDYEHPQRNYSLGVQAPFGVYGNSKGALNTDSLP